MKISRQVFVAAAVGALLVLAGASFAAPPPLDASDRASGASVVQGALGAPGALPQHTLADVGAQVPRSMRPLTPPRKVLSMLPYHYEYLTEISASSPQGVAVDRMGSVFVADFASKQIRKFVPIWNSDFFGQLVGYVPAANWACYMEGRPRSLAIGPSGLIYVVNQLEQTRDVETCDANGANIGQAEILATGAYPLYEFVTAATSGEVFVVDSAAQKIENVSVPNISTQGAIPTPKPQPLAAAVDPYGYVFVTYGANSTVQKLDPKGNVVAEWGETGSGPGQFYIPWGIAVDNVGGVYVADAGNNRIQKFDSDGKFITAFGNVRKNGQPGNAGEPGIVQTPPTAAVDPAGDLVFVPDPGFNRVEVFVKVYNLPVP